MSFGGVALALSATVIWSGNLVAARGLRDEVPPAALAFWRCAVAVAALTPCCLAPLRSQLPLVRRHIGVLALMAASGIAVFTVLVYVAAHTTTAANIALVGITVSVFIILLAWLTRQDRLGRRGLLGSALALTGVVLLITGGSLTSFSPRPGDLWMVGANVAFAGYSLLLRRLPSGLGGGAVLLATFALALVLLLPVYLVEFLLVGGFEVTFPFLAALAYTGVLSSALAYLCWSRAIERIGASKAGLVYFLLPVFSAVLGVFLLSETVSALQVLTMALVVAGVVTGTRTETTKRSRTMPRPGRNLESTAPQGRVAEPDSTAESLSISPWPRTRYTSPQVYEAERERIFARSWWCVGRSEAVAEPGAFLRVTVDGESVLLVRGRDGRVRGLINLCRHRGARLCLDEQGRFGKSIRCMYHGWTYGLDGRLLSGPYLRDLPEQTKRERSLHTVAVTEWLGYLWASLARHPAPPAQALGPQLRTRFGEDDVLARYDLPALRVARTLTYDVRANWKLVFENFAECYHCPTLHPELTAALPYFRSGYGTVSGGTGQGARLADHLEGFSLSGRATARRLPRLNSEDSRTFYGVVLWPGVVLVLVPDHVACLRFEPLGPERTRIVTDWLFHPRDLTDPATAARVDDAVGLLDLANRQDFAASERCQLGVQSRYFEECYPRREHVIDAFHQWVDEAMNAPEPANSGTVQGP